MPLYSGFSGVSLGSFLVVVGCVAWCVGCGSDASAPAGLLAQAPHCAESSVLRVEGTIDGSAISDTRLTNINAALVNIGSPEFDTPSSTLAALQGAQVAMSLRWANTLAYGDTGPMTGGSLTLPAEPGGNAQAYCIYEGEVGFVDGGEEDGVFKFSISEVSMPLASLYPVQCPPQAQDPLVVDVRGCYR